MSVTSEMTPLSESPFSYHFTVLCFLGSWLYETESSFKANVYILYKVFVAFVGVFGLMSLFLDLYMVLGDMKKMTWNLCVTVLLFGIVIRSFQMFQKRELINELRVMLHRDAELRHLPEDLSINDLALKELKLLRNSFYATAIVSIPTWFVTRYSGYFWGFRDLPIPFHLPEFIDLENDVLFHLVYLTLAMAGILGLLINLEAELAMYGLLIQITREYRVLVKDISQINKMYEDGEVAGGWQREMNPGLRKIKTSILVKKYSARQRTLTQYTQTFEDCFNQTLFHEFLGMSVLIVILALQCLWESVDFSGYLIYQIGYLFINVMDMFWICLLSTKLHTLCLEVGQSAYSTLWYEMDIKVQKSIMMIIMRSQHPPKITVGKFMELSLNTYMNTMSNLYGWLTMFRQFELSSST